MLTRRPARSRSASMARSTISARSAPSWRPRAIVFRTESDTEVILAAWRQWGPDCLARLNGMFAFALYDAGQDCLFLARDRLGVKPLFYAELSDGALIFASELKGLLAHPLLRRDARARRRSRTISPSATSPTTPRSSRACASSPPAIICSSAAAARCRRRSQWWDVDFSNPVARLGARRSRRRWSSGCAPRSRSRMVADVPLGAFLSGGVDSSAVVAFMAEASRGAVETCSIGFDEADHDETRYAAKVAELFATNHRSRIVAADDFALIDTLADAFDEPFADASALATYRVSELAREKVKVSLSGDGADEAFAGYRRYRMFAAEERARRLLPGPARAAPPARSAIVYPKLDWAPQMLPRQDHAAGARAGQRRGLCRRPSASRRPRSGRCFTRQTLSDAAARPRRRGPLCPGLCATRRRRDALSRAQYADLKIWLPGDILTKVDRDQHGGEPRGARAAARPPPGRVRRPAAGADAAARRQRQMADEARAGRAAARRDPPPPQDGLRHPGLAPGSAARSPAEAAAIAHGSALAETGWFDAAAIARLAEAHRARPRRPWPAALAAADAGEVAAARCSASAAALSARPDSAPRRNRARRAAR